MQEKSNREIERHYFEMFRRNYSLPSGMITYGDKPDVILEGESKIGIEITNFYVDDGKLPGSEQRQRGLRDVVISKAYRMYEERKNKKIELTFGFDEKTPIGSTKKVIQKLSRDLVTLAEKVKEYEAGPIRGAHFQNIPELSYAYLYAKECSIPKWRTAQVYSGSIMSRDKLIAIVREKELLSYQYEKCDSLWLLIVVDFADRAQDQEIRIDNFEKVGSNVFDKIFVYKTHFSHVLEAK